LEKCLIELKNKVKELERKLHEYSTENTNLPAPEPMGDFYLTPAYHTYSVAHICILIWVVLKAGVRLRAASRVFEIISSYFGLKQSVPSWYTVRFWLLRLGYYKLHREKERADDWIWMVDHTGQAGREKCLLIMGIRQSRLPDAELYLNFEDVEPIELLPVKKSNGEIVYEQLTQAAKKTGAPREIVGDHGSDIKSGIEKFCRENGHTCYIYDIKHKAAAILKRELKDDPEWNEFFKKCSQTRRQVYQTRLSGFAPPNQRSKARYMNVNKLVEWGTNTLIWFDQRDDESRDNDSREDEPDGYDSMKIDEKLGWVKEYRDHLDEWSPLIRLIESAVSFIKFSGIYHGCHIDLEKELEISSNSEWVDEIREELLTFVKGQSIHAKGNERLLGSSELIESAFGKYKDLEQEQVKSGISGILLGLPAFLSTTTREVICEAIENTSTENVLKWLKENIGESVQSQRKKILKTVREAEQKRAEKLCIDSG
jgi:hypothetical protein